MNRSSESFNGAKYGKFWNSIDFELPQTGDPDSRPNQDVKPTIGFLIIGNRRFEITESEANRICETLEDGKHKYKVARSLGQLESNNGTYREY